MQNVNKNDQNRGRYQEFEEGRRRNYENHTRKENYIKDKLKEKKEAGLRIQCYETEFPSLEEMEQRRKEKRTCRNQDFPIFSRQGKQEGKQEEEEKILQERRTCRNQDFPIFSRQGKQEGKQGEEERILQDKDKLEIIKELEEEQDQHVTYGCEMKDIALDRIHRPRRKDNMEDKEIYNTLFKGKCEERKRIPVLTLMGKIAKNTKDKIKCIVDTGSNLNLINSKLVQENNIMTNKKPKVVSANGTPITIWGKTTVNLIIDNIVIRDEFYVSPDINSEIILGNKFLLNNKVELDFKKKEIKLNLGEYKHRIQMRKEWIVQVESINCINQEGGQLVKDIRTEEEIVIAPHQHRRIKINGADDDVYFEAEKWLKEKKKCHAYLTEKDEEGHRYLNIYNASNFPKYIKGNSILGFLTKEHCVRTEDRKGQQKYTTSNINKEKLTDKDGFEINISPHLSLDQHKQVVTMLKKYINMFTTRNEDLEPAKLPPVALEKVPNAKPVNSTPYRHSKIERDELENILDDLVRSDILEECDDYTEWASPVFLVKNKDGTRRLVADMRKVNNVLKPAIHPTPSVNLVLSCLNKANTYSRIDLKGAFHQLLVREEDRNLLTIKTQSRLLRYKRLTMGLKVSTALFGKALLALLNKHLYNKVVCYVDDCITYGTSFSSDLKNAEEILKILNEANLKLNTKKCQFMYKEINILGYTVSKEGFLPQKETVEAISQFKRPNCLRKVRQFLGMTGYFRRHIKMYAQISLPLTELIKEANKGKPFKWNENAENSFLKLKEMLIKPPLLRHWNDNWEPIIYVDASLYALGGVLLQENPETGNTHPIAYISRKFTETQKRYSNAERELLALVYTVTKFREYILGRRTTVYTDCQALQYYKNFKDCSSRLNRLALSLVDYDLDVKYKAGTSNLVADSLSRNPIEKTVDEDVLEVNANFQEIKEEDFGLLQNQDPYLREIKLAKIAPDQVDKNIRRDSRLYEERDGILYYKRYDGQENKYLLALPKVKVPEILRTFHDNIYSGGHFSDYKTLEKVRSRFHWPSMTKDVMNYTKTCEQCQLKRPSTYKTFGKLNPQVPATKPFQRIIIDFLGPISQSNGFKYILVITDSCTRMAFTKATRSADASTVAKVLLELFCIYGYPKIICHDQGTAFMSTVVKQLLKSLGIEQKWSPPHSQNIQGLSEKFNATVKKMISHYVENDPKSWSTVLKYVTFAYNTSKQSSTGYTPFYLMFGREADLPTDYIYVHKDQEHEILKEIKLINRIRQEMPKIMEKAQNTQKAYFDKKRRDLNLNPGDEILIRYPKDTTKQYSKFQNVFKGPYPIVKKINDLTYLVSLYKNGRLVEEPIHVSNMKVFYRR